MAASVPRGKLDQFSSAREFIFLVYEHEFLRIKNVNLGYTLPKSWTNKLGIANAKIYYTGENLFTFDSLPFNADPESPSGNLDVYPISRSHSFGINVTF